MVGVQVGNTVGGKYQILQCLGAGGMGAVYLAKDNRYPDFKVALKVLYPGALRSAEAKERFHAEINAAYRVKHENVVQAYEFFDQEGMIGFAMEFLEGGDLLMRIQERPLSPHHTAQIMRQIASGLAAIHAEGVVHRDLKPENVLLDPNGKVKITDFGVARLGIENPLTKNGAMVGTPKYLAPEYVEFGVSDHRGDIYALGVIGYECLTGESPFRSETKRSLINERLQDRSVELAVLAPNCPKELERIIRKAMQVDVRRRYQSAAEIEHDLVSFLNGDKSPKKYITSSHKRIKVRVRRKVRFFLEDVPLWLKGILTLSALSMIFMVVVMLRGDEEQFNKEHNLPIGRFEGEASDILGGVKKRKIVLVVTDKIATVQLDIPFCKTTELANDGSFRCGERTFILSSKTSVRGKSIAGSIEEPKTASIATWYASRRKS